MQLPTLPARGFGVLKVFVGPNWVVAIVRYKPRLCACRMIRGRVESQNTGLEDYWGYGCSLVASSCVAVICGQADRFLLINLSEALQEAGLPQDSTSNVVAEYRPLALALL